MKTKITIRLVNHKTGEIYSDVVKSDFLTTKWEHKEILYRWCDCFLRAVDKGESFPMIEIYANKMTQEPDIF